jgi:hypothetical protein
MPQWLRRARAALVAAGLLLAFALALLWPQPARAQAVVQKTLCVGVASQLPSCPASASVSSVSLGQPVYYEVTILGSTGPVDLKEIFPPGFQLTGVVCTGQSNLPLSPIVTGLSSGAVCQFSGSFGAGSTSGANNVVELRATHTNPVIASDSHNAAIPLNGPLPSDLKITKTADLASIDVSAGPQLVTYTITLENLGANDLLLGTLLQIADRLALLPNSVALNAQLVSSTCAVQSQNSTLLPLSDCLQLGPNQPPNVNPLLIGYAAPHDFAVWEYPAGTPGLLRVGDKIVLTVVVQVSKKVDIQCVVAPNSDGFVEAAHILLTLPPAAPGMSATTLADLIPGNNSAQVPLQVITGETQVDPNCNAPYKPKLAIAKIQTSPTPATGVPWNPSGSLGPTVDYKVTVQNVSATHSIRNIQLVDVVREGIGTPPFLATLDSHTCAASDCTNLNPIAMPVALQGYNMAATVFGAQLYGGSSLPSNGSMSFTIRMRYHAQKCDSFRDGAFDPIHNHVQVASWEEVDNNTQQSVNVTLAFPLDQFVTTNMQEAPACPLKVSKTPTNTGPFAPPRIVFNTPYSYTVSYENTDPVQSFTVGTLIDTLRFTPPGLGGQPYAISLKVDYNYACVPFGPISGHPTANASSPGNDIAYIVANALPQQGVRLIQNSGPVTFGPSSKLVCTVVVTVNPPAASDPYCWTADLDNSAILDMSAYYDPNFPWSTNPGNTNMWATVTKPLPACFNWAVNKFVTPAWTTPGGGPLSWSYTIFNAGPPMTTGGPLISDQFLNAANNPLAAVVTGFSVGCPIAGSCPNPQPGWLINNPIQTPPGGTSVLVPFNLGHGQTLQTNLTVQNAPASVVHGGKACNRVWASLPNFGTGSYWKNLNTLTDTACALILDVGFVKVTKQVVNNTGLATPASYQVTLACTYPGITLPATTFNLASGASGTAGNIPIGSTCTVSDSPPVPPGSNSCAFPVWQISSIPLSPFTTSMTPGATTSVTLKNTLTCRPVSSIRIQKTTSVPSGLPPPPLTFSFSVSCSPMGPNGIFPVPANGQLIIPNIPIVSTCTVAEIVPTYPIPDCSWTATPNPVTLTVNVPIKVPTAKFTNKLVCTGKIRIKKSTSVPLGTSLPASILFNVNCSPGGAFTITMPPNGLSAPLTVATPSACSVTEQVPPAPAGCFWTVVKFPPGNVSVPPVGTATVNFTNKLTCKPGRLTIKKKQTIVPPGVPAPGAFQFNVNCQPGGPTTVVTVPASGQNQVVNIPAPASCTVVEQFPTPPPGCTWNAVQTPSGNIAVPPNTNVLVTVINKLTCQQTGTLVIVKTIQGFANQGPPPGTVDFNVDCGPGPGQNVQVATNGSPFSMVVPAPATCVVTEYLPPSFPPCFWSVTQSPAGPVTTIPGGTVTVTFHNQRVCSGASTLLLRKMVLLSGSSTPVSPNQLPFAASAVFEVDVACPGSPAIRVALSAANGFQAVTGPYPIATQCTFQEVTPPAGLAPCTWLGVSYPQGQGAVIAGNQIVREIHNLVSCPALPPIARAPARGAGQAAGLAARPRYRSAARRR